MRAVLEERTVRAEDRGRYPLPALLSVSSRRQLQLMKRKTVRAGNNHVLLTLKSRPNQGGGFSGGTEQHFKTKCHYHLKRLNSARRRDKGPRDTLSNLTSD